MEVEFPEYEEWYEEAVETNWGWGDFEPTRLSDSFRPDPVGPPGSGNGR